MKLNRYKITVTSTNTYVREVVAKNEDEAINEFIETINDGDKISEEQFDVEDILDLGDESKVYHD